MHIWGKILGAFFGFLLGGPVGLALGLLLGHRFDKARRLVGQSGFTFQQAGSQAERQAEFFHAAFAVMGHVAKAKGKVTREEIQLASAMMDRMSLHGDSRREAQNAFREGKDSDFPLRETLRKIRRITGGRHDLMQFFLELQISAAFADGDVHPKEREVLHAVAHSLGFSAEQLEQRLKMQEAAFNFQQGGGQQGYQQSGWQQANSVNQLSHAYKLLGVEEDASSQQLKRAYRKLMNEHHPDKLVAKGLPPEMMEMAKEKAQEIQAAYDLIKKVKGFK